MSFRIVTMASVGALLAGCAAVEPVPEISESERGSETDIAEVVDVAEPVGLLPFETFTLENGLTVIFHIDRSDPVVAVNLTAPILLAQGLTPNLAQADNARIILIGSTSGLPNSATVEVANTASKFGLLGAAVALNLSLRSYGIATTVINPSRNIFIDFFQIEIQADSVVQ